ncbi:MAG: GNAT family N-acetyltransferase [Clostridia bacterium]|nr:GNAT family N-acetyltransferase [Clostridia bacterium]
MIRDIILRKIESKEISKLKRLFPSDEKTWFKYKSKRLLQLENKETDIFVIEYKDMFIGELSVNYTSYTLISETIPNIRVYLEAFRIDEKYRGRGLGKRLISYTISELEKSGYTQFTIGVEEDNKIAKHIYFKFGFTEAIDYGQGDEFDPCKYTLYLLDVKK